MRYIVGLELKKLISNRASAVYIIGYCFMCGIFIPYFTNSEFNALNTILIFSAITQISPAVFAKEREDRTFETLVSLPVSMRKIFLSKAIYCCIIIVTMLYISYVLNYAMGFFTYNLSINHFEIRNIVVYLIMLPILIFNISYHATYVSFKSNDSKASAIKTIYIGVPYYFISTILIEASKKPDKVFIFTIVSYILINIVIFIMLGFKTKKYFKKSKLLQLLND